MTDTLRRSTAAIGPEPRRRFVHALAAVLAGGWAIDARAADASERKFIRKGMPEGEVVFRIGKPDHEAFIRAERGEPEEKSWTYFPHSRDPQTLTIITLRAGVVAQIDRKIAR